MSATRSPLARPRRRDRPPAPALLPACPQSGSASRLPSRPVGTGQPWPAAAGCHVNTDGCGTGDNVVAFRAGPGRRAGGRAGQADPVTERHLHDRILSAAEIAIEAAICDHPAETAENSGGALACPTRPGRHRLADPDLGQARQQVLELAAVSRPGPGQGRAGASCSQPLRAHPRRPGSRARGRDPGHLLRHPAADQIAYVAGDCDARIAVLDGAAELARWQQVLDRLPGVKKIIVRDPAACPPGDQYLTWTPSPRWARSGSLPIPGAISARIRPSGRRTRSPCCTPRAPPATPRACCSPTTMCSTRCW